MIAAFIGQGLKFLPAFVFLIMTSTNSLAQALPMLIKADGGQIEAFVFGKGPQTLIMAAGNGRPAAQLEVLAKGLAGSGLRVVTYNYRGLGASTGETQGITLHDYAQDVWRIADALGATQVHLAGKTYGNRVMRAASQARPDRVLSIVLIGAGGEVPPSAETMALYKRYTDPSISKEEWLKLQGLINYAPGNEHLAKIDAEQGEFPAVAAAQIKADAATPRAEWSGGGTAPMLVMTCLLDRVALPEGALQLVKSRPHSWLVGIPGCGHNMVNEVPEALQSAIADFVLTKARR